MVIRWGLLSGQRPLPTINLEKLFYEVNTQFQYINWLKWNQRKQARGHNNETYAVLIMTETNYLTGMNLFPIRNSAT